MYNTKYNFCFYFYLSEYQGFLVYKYLKNNSFSFFFVNMHIYNFSDIYMVYI